jgi:hypothetical protein
VHTSLRVVNVTWVDFDPLAVVKYEIICVGLKGDGNVIPMLK